ncbi:MAG: hypothetical protein R3250_09375 [Melioribacteraceae bacterium]|nr:hypothetical protein [Melioribacteraceae bacterium]
MSLELFIKILAWSTTINIAILIFWLIIFISARDMMYKMHTKWFKMSEETFSAIHYGGLGIYRMLILFFNLIPYLILRIAI